jgi:transcriptional regulator with XRE-family HTH domain
MRSSCAEVGAALDNGRVKQQAQRASVTHPGEVKSRAGLRYGVARKQQTEGAVMADKPPTPKLQALGAAIRKAREAKDLSLRDLAGMIGNQDAGALSRYEKGERAAKPEKVAQILATLGVNGEQYESIMALTRDTDGPLWVAVTLPEQRHQTNALLDFEARATKLTAVGPLIVPGLCQTKDYVHGMMSADDDVPAHEINMRIAVRMGRREAISGPNPVPLDVFVGEAALDQLIGTPSAMAGQLRHLAEMSERPNINLRVMPKMGGWHPGLEGNFDFIECEPMPVVHIGTRPCSLFLHSERDVDSYRRSIDQVSRVALSPEDSAGLIAMYITRWEK